MRRNQKGFTLMELMVVIVIVAILAAVAVPLYINYVKDAQRTEAKGAIGAVITAQQTYFQEFGTYAPTIAELKTKQNLDLTDVEHNWRLELSGLGPNTFTVDAIGQGTQTTGLDVHCEYRRGFAPVWSEQTAPPAP